MLLSDGEVLMRDLGSNPDYPTYVAIKVSDHA
jgi:hypothetical protein